MFLRNGLCALLATAILSGPLLAVGLGPLQRSGVTDGSGKIFYLTLINPYPHAETFEAVPVANDSEAIAPRVVVFPPRATVHANGSRRLLVIIKPLAPGETYAFRVCAARPPQPKETIYARVCSHLVARRLPEGRAADHSAPDRG
jgi:hypothetical protein